MTFNLTATPTDMFPGRLAAPRFVQYGQDFAGAPSDWVYVYFPGTTGDAAFFENNDEILLGRVDKTQILDRASYQFFNGVGLDGTVQVRAGCQGLAAGAKGPGSGAGHATAIHCYSVCLQKCYCRWWYCLLTTALLPLVLQCRPCHCDPLPLFAYNDRR